MAHNSKQHYRNHDNEHSSSARTMGEAARPDFDTWAAAVRRQMLASLQKRGRTQ